MGNRLVVDLRVEGDARVWLAGLRLELGHDAIRRYASQAICEQARASELESSSRVGSENKDAAVVTWPEQRGGA
jgi:hypothetical protein